MATEREHGISPLLRKIITTTVSGGTTLMITLLTRQSIVESVNLSVLVGGVALLVEFLLEFDARLVGVEEVLAEHTGSCSS